MESKGCKKVATLHGENGNSAKMGLVEEDLSGDMHVIATVSSDWYRAEVETIVSRARVADLCNDLENNKSEIMFINENGNFEMNITRQSNRSIFRIEGLVCKSMADDLQLHYGFDALHSSIDQFLSELRQW